MHVVMKEVGVFAHTLIIFMPGLNARGLQSKLLKACSHCTLNAHSIRFNAH